MLPLLRAILLGVHLLQKPISLQSRMLDLESPGFFSPSSFQAFEIWWEGVLAQALCSQNVIEVRFMDKTLPLVKKDTFTLQFFLRVSISRDLFIFWCQ
jgi:hypothetical protein